MRLATAVLVLAAVGLIAADEPKKDDTEAFKGKWATVSIKVAGQDAPADEIKKLKLTFDAKTYTNIVGDQTVEEGDYAIDSSKTPKTIDFDIKKGPDQGKKQLGIYKVEGDKLIMVVALPGSTERPKSWKPAASENMIEATFEREKR